MLLSKTISVSPKLLLLHGSSTLSIFLNLGNGCYLFFGVGAVFVEIVKTMLGLDAPYLACHQQNDLSKQKSF